MRAVADSAIHRSIASRSPARSERSTSARSLAELGQRRRDEVAVGDEDVRPDGRIRAGDARHLAQRRAGVAEGVLARPGGGAHEQVRERVRQVARHRQKPVVLGRIELHRPRAKRGDEALHDLHPRRLGHRRRGQEPDRAVEEVGARARGTAGRAAGERVAGDEPRVLDRREHALRRADVGDGRIRRRRERVPNRGDDGAHGHRDDDELCSRDRVRQRCGGLDRRLPQHRGVCVPAAHGGDAGATRGERDRRAEQACADDREP